MELNSLLLSSLYNILIIIPCSILSKYPRSLLCQRIDICFVGKEDIRPEVLYYLILILLAISYPVILIFTRDLLLNKHILINLTAIYILSKLIL